MLKEHFLKNLEYGAQQKEDESRKKKQGDTKAKGTINLDFFNSTTDDFLLTTDSQSLLGEDPLLFTVEQDRLQPISSRFMVPGIYKRIEGVAFNDGKLEFDKPNVFISETERHGRIVSKKDFERLYILSEECDAPPLSRVLLVEPMESDDEEGEEAKKLEGNKNSCEVNSKKDQIPKEWDALNRLAYDILKLTNRDHIVIDRKRNEIIRTQFNTQQKTIYRFLAPELMGLEPGPASTNQIIDVDQDEHTAVKQKPVNKLGRPRKRQQDEQIVKKPNKLHKKESNNTKPVANETEPPTKSATNVRTRSVRLIKAPSSLQVNNNKQLLPPPLNPQENIKDLLNELRDGDYHNSKHKHTIKAPLNEAENLVEAANTETPTEAAHSPSKRKVPPEAICPTCKKIFLGRRLQRHFTQHPEHMQIPSTNVKPLAATTYAETSQSVEDMSLFRFLISKLQNSQSLNEDQKADLFLNELNDLVEQLQLRSNRLIRNTSGLHFVNQRCSKLLGIPEGQYALDLSAIEAPLEPELADTTSTQINHTQPNNINTRSLDYTNLSITLDDTLTDEAAQKLNLSAGGKLLPPSEESLLRAVDDLVQTDINKIHASSMLQQQPATNTNSLTSTANNSSLVAKLLPPHIDHASDNAVEAVNMKETTNAITTAENPLLDLSVDFFQFNN